MENLVGSTLESFKILSVLGEGGMGIVYKAYDTKLDRHVAIKMLKTKVLKKERFIEKFKTEARNQAKLGHPNIVTVYGFIEHDGVLGIVIEYVEGESLDKIIQREKKLHIEDVIFIFRQVLLGMKYAHSRGFIHRDLKPSNIIITPSGIAKIMDFGISVSLESGTQLSRGKKIGTIFYMSPEQIEGRDISIMTDIYSLGCSFYEMVTGDPPFVFTEEKKILDAHLNSEPYLISRKFSQIPEMVDLFLSRALRKDPHERYQDCEEFLFSLRELENYLKSLQTASVKNEKKKKKKIKAYSIIGAAVFLVLFIAISYVIFSQVQTLIESGELEKLKKYDVGVLFENSNSGFSFENTQNVNFNSTANLNSIRFLGNNVLACGDSGTVFIYNVNDKSKNQITINPNLSFNDIGVLSSGRFIIVGDSTVIIESSNFFNNFTVKYLDKSLGFSLQSIFFVDDNQGFIVGTSGLILSTTNSGISWDRRISPTGGTLFDVCFLDKQNGFAVGWDGVILSTENGGYSWNVLQKITNKYLKSIDFFGSNGVIVGGGGTILFTNDNGKSWEIANSANSESLVKVKYFTENQVIAIGAKGVMLISEDAGENWKKIESNTYLTLNDLDINSEGQIFMAGVNGNILQIKK